MLATAQTYRFNFVAGLSYLKDEGFFDFELTGSSFGFFAIPPGASNEVETESISGFVEVTYELTDNIAVTAGGRYTKDERDLNVFNNPTFQLFGLPAILSEEDEYNAFTPRLVLSWSNDSTNVYYSYTEGFKAGGISTPANPPVIPVDPEEIASHEIGIKHKAFNDRLSTSLAVFYYEDKDFQSQVLDIDGAGGGGSLRVENAGGIDGKGIELEVTALVADGFSIGSSLAYLDVEYESYDNASAICLDFSGTGNPTAPGSVLLPCALDLGGERVPHAPEFSGSIYASYDFNIADWGANLSGLLYYTSSYDFVPAAGGALGHDEQDAYTVVNFSGYVSPPGSTLQVGFYLDNAFDEEYKLRAETTSPYGASFVAAEPRTYGMRISYDF